LFNRCCLTFLFTAACLLLASGAAAAPSSFTVAATPSHVKPSSSTTYTVTLTNSSSSDPKGADRATIAVEGFELVGPPTSASVTECGNPRTWDAEVAPDGKTITLQRSGASTNNLCPGGILAVSFTANSPAIEGLYTWPTAMFHGDEVFTGAAPPTVSVDGTAPETTIESGPPSLTKQTTASFSFRSNEAGSTFECRLDGAAAFAACPPQPYTGLAEGGHTLRVRAIDPAGNTDPSPAIYTWTIDLIGPATMILTGPPSASNSASASFTFSSEAGVFECSLDGAAFSACTNPKSYSNLVDGPHVFAVRAIDSANNTGPASSHRWTIETRPPTAAIASGPAALTNSRSAALTFAADEPSSFQCQLDGGSFLPCSSPASYQGLGDGAHTFAVRATDAVGNSSPLSSYGWTIDATAPETTLGSRPRTGTTTVSATFTFSANEAARFECKLDAAAFASCVSPRSYAGLRRSAHSFEVRAIDAAGNVDATSAVHRWIIATAPRRAKTASALLAPRAGARVTSPPLLVWRRVPRASFYNMQLYRGRVKVLSAWPTRPRLQLRARWTYRGRQQKLSAGTYRWYVWPAFRVNRYGRLLGQSTFTVTRGSTR